MRVLRLLDVDTLRIIRPGRTIPPYATLSHSWEDGEITFSDFHGLDKCNLSSAYPTTGFSKIRKACLEARTFGVGYLWVDVLCIDPSSSAELSEGINSMFRIYQDSQICLAHLSDVNTRQEPLEVVGKHLERSRWISRVWVLQELIASKRLQFYDNQWVRIGTKESLLPILSSLVQLDSAVLENSECLFEFSIGRRMSWAARLSATRPEDIAYSLLGIFGVSMTILYGEGERAFIRLQEEILKDTDDATLFAWQSTDGQHHRGLLAHSPSEFSRLGVYSEHLHRRIQGSIQTSSAGILINDVFGARTTGQEIFLCLLGPSNRDEGKRCLGISLEEWGDRYVRSSPHSLFNLDEEPKGDSKRICILRDVSSRTSDMIETGISPLLNPQNESECVKYSNTRLGKKRDTTGTLLLDRPVSTTPQIDLNQCRELGGRGLSQDVKSRSVAVSMINKEPSGFMGTMVPLGSRHGIQARGGKILDARESFNDSESEETDKKPYQKSSNKILTLDDNHPLTKFTNELTDHGLLHFSRWISSRERKRTLSPPTRKRLKPEYFKDYIAIEYISDSEDMEAVIVKAPSLTTAPHFTCPFQRRLPERYQSCLKQGGFSNFRNLTQHLLAAHQLPHYCPICHQIFSKASDCDDHIRQRSCNQITAPEIEGVTEIQIGELFELANPLQSKEEQWCCVWDNVFCETTSPPPSYLASDVESLIRLLRYYWSREGQEIVLDFLKLKELQSEEIYQSTSDIMALNQKILDQMVDNLLELFTQVKDEEGGDKRVRELLEGLRRTLP